MINDQEFVLEGFLLYAAVGVPLILGMLVCRGRSMFARICIVGLAIIIVSVGVASVYASPLEAGDERGFLSSRIELRDDLALAGACPFRRNETRARQLL